MFNLQHVNGVGISPFSRREPICLLEPFTARKNAPQAARLMQEFCEIATVRLFNERKTVSPSMIWSLWYCVVTLSAKLTTTQKLHGQTTLLLYEGD